jgi:hypothetical protein
VQEILVVELVIDRIHSQRREYHRMMLAKDVLVGIEDGRVSVGLFLQAEGGHSVGPHQYL